MRKTSMGLPAALSAAGSGFIPANVLKSQVMGKNEKCLMTYVGLPIGNKWQNVDPTKIRGRSKKSPYRFHEIGIFNFQDLGNHLVVQMDPMTHTKHVQSIPKGLVES
ncbi:hypothetical protein Syun_019230 [Stephania yunnanensis]|uniref:Uncharacterized protein n=1 Tax=Stephania yunnanensis TaxID=152371 RepID=A0AAP0NWH3_9MAGN